MLKKMITLLLASVIFSCQQAPESSDKIIATSIFPIYDWTRILIQDESQIINILPEGANPHHFEPTPRTIRRLQTVQLFIGIDPHFDGWVESLLPEETTVIYLGQIFGHHHEEGQNHHHHDDHENPHHWLSIQKSKRMIHKLAEVLKKSLSEQSDSIDIQLNQYSAALDELDEEINQHFENVQNRSFVQWHPAWNDFADDYGLNIVGTLSYGHGDTPSLKKMQILINDVKKQNTSVVVQGLHESQTASIFAKETNSRLVTLHTISSQKDTSYINMMRSNAQALAQGLQSSQR